MKNKTKQISVLCGAIWMASISITPCYAQETDVDDNIYELNPFVVSESEDVGWMSNSSLAGTRFKADLKDIPAAIDVLTKEFLEDNAITSLEEAALYANNAEGNLEFIDASESFDWDGTASLINPGNATRVRGLKAPDRTRNYFTVQSPIDMYNMDRLTYNRGPNAILFGLGSPTGVIDSTPMRANMSKDRGSVQFRTDSEGSLRFAGNYNKVIVDDMLAFRFALLNDDQKTQWYPEYDKDKRYYLTLGYEPFKNTRIDVSYENIDRNASRSRKGYVADGLTAWYDAGQPSYNPVTGEHKINGVVVTDELGNPVNPGGSKSLGNNSLYFMMNSDGSIASPYAFNRTGDISNGDAINPTAEYFRTTGLAEAFDPGTGVGTNEKNSLTDPTIFPLFYNTVSGAITDDRAEIFDAILNQKILENWFIEISYHKENYDQEWLSFGRGYNAAPKIDINEVTLTGEPNPNFGRYFIDSEPYGIINYVNSEVARATTTYSYDFQDKHDGWLRWFGRHQLAGLVERSDSENVNSSPRLKVINNPLINGIPLYNDNAGIGDLNLRHLIYLDDPNRPGDVTALQKTIEPNWDEQVYEGLTFPIRNNAGTPDDASDDTFNWVAPSEPLRAQWKHGDDLDQRLLRIDSKLLVYQTSLLKGHVIGVYGYREDDTSRYTAPKVYDARGFNLINEDGVQDIEENLDFSIKSVIRNKGVVVHGFSFFDFLSAHYQESSNYNPNPRISMLGRPLPSEDGVGKDYGFSINLMEDKLYIKVNWYENSLTNVNINPVRATMRWMFNGFEGALINWYKNALVPNAQGKVNEAVAQIIQENNLHYEFPSLPVVNDLNDHWNAVEGLPARGTISNPTRNVAFLEAIGYDGPTAEFNEDLTNDAWSVGDVVSEGMEIDVFYQIKKNWFVKLNVSQTETIQDNIAPDVFKYFESRMAWYQENAFPYLRDPSKPWQGTWETFFNNQIGTRLQTGLDLQGSPQPQIREWRANLNTSYTFNDGRFDGLTVGGAVRWRSAAAIGFERMIGDDGTVKNDINNTIDGDPITDIDGFLSYRMKNIIKGVDCTLQLNIRNLFNDREPMKQLAQDVRTLEDIQSGMDPNPVILRYAPKLPRTFILSATFSF